MFPDPVPKEVDGVIHYEQGSDPTEKFLPSKLEDVEKKPHNISFPPTANTAKNVGFMVKCEECQKPRLLHAKHKIKEDLKGAKRMMAKLNYVCGSIISEYMGTGADRDEKYLKNIFVRENLYIMRQQNRASLLRRGSLSKNMREAQAEHSETHLSIIRNV